MQSIRSYLTSLNLSSIREHIGDMRHLPLLSLLNIVIGILTVLVVVAFRMSIEWGHELLLGVDFKSISEMPAWARFCVPLGGAVLVALVGRFLKVDGRQVGVIHVMHQQQVADSRMPLRNSLMQFVGGSLALSSGSPGGWLGPAIHLGASAASLVHWRLSLPPDSVRTLLAASVASAITACIDTPIAGVLLASEVILLRFTFASFVPVMLAAGTSSVIMRILGFGPLIQFPEVTLAMNSLTEFALILPAGILIGLIAAGFNYSIEITSGIHIRSFTIRCLIVGLVVGLVALAWNEILGSGFEVFTFDLEYWQAWTFVALIGFILVKFLLVSLSVGFGMPVGIISPCLVTGAVFGVVMYKTVVLIMPAAETSDLAFYMLLGSCAMLAAVLNAPLTALITVFELSGSTHIIFSEMLLIAVACLTAAPLYGRKSVFEARLRVITDVSRTQSRGN